MKIRKCDVDFALRLLKEKAMYAKMQSDNLTREDCNIDYGRYLAFMEAINVIKYLIL